MIITFGQARTLLAKYAGKAGTCPTDQAVALFIKKVVQQLLFRGANGNVRKWVFDSEEGRITAPPDLEIPISVRVDQGAKHHTGMVYDKWYEFYDQSTLNECIPWEEGLVEEVNPYFTAFDIPKGGKHILAIPTCKEAEDAHFVIMGKNRDGRDVYLPQKGIKLKGEYLSIDASQNRYTNEVFTEITGIEKSETNGYVKLFWYEPDTGRRGLLGDYRPSDTLPSYRRFRLVHQLNHFQKCKSVRVTILGRVRFVDNYADNDVIPISNIRTLELMAQTFQAEDNDNLEAANYKERSVLGNIENENQYKRTPSASINFERETSPGNIKNII